MKHTLLASAALLLLATGAFADSASVKAVSAKAIHKTTRAKAAKAVNLVCPVTGEKIASIKDAAGSSTYKGKTYYFCCGGCKPAFDKNPEKFLKTSSSKTTGQPNTKS